MIFLLVSLVLATLGETDLTIPEYMEAYTGPGNYSVAVLSVLSVPLNSCVNALIYTWRLQNFRSWLRGSWNRRSWGLWSVLPVSDPRTSY